MQEVQESESRERITRKRSSLERKLDRVFSSKAELQITKMSMDELMREVIQEDHREGSYKCQISNEEREISLAVMRAQLDILEEWLQQKENEDRR